MLQSISADGAGMAAEAAARLDRFGAAEDGLVSRVRLAVDGGRVHEPADERSRDGDSP
jgi:hypothetical protein